MATIRSDASGPSRPSQARGPEHDGAGLGELLRQARERRGVTLEQIAHETKIPRRHLEALEHDNPAAVPGGFYRRAQVRVFAQAVNLDRDLAVSRLERSWGGRRSPRRRRHADRSRANLFGSAGCCCS